MSWAKTMDRPRWNRLEADIAAGKVCKLVVWRLDRLGRTASGLTALFEGLQSRQIGFESLRDKVDLSTPSGRLMANVLASVAAYENEVRSERIIAGQSAARAAGKTWGGSKNGRRIKVTDEQIATIRRMADEGQSKTAMARATGLSRPTVYSVLATTSPVS
jgi:DNA invertase Pin-like site-specific DNA recombinase